MAADTLLAERPQPELGSDGGAGLAPLIELRHVSKSYVGAEGPAVTILDDISLEVREGEMVALLGQSGSGKSTILRLMAGLTEPTQGAVLGHGAPVDGVNPNIAIVFQSFALYPWLIVQENVQVGLMQRRLTAEQEQEEIDRALELIGLSGYENAYPKKFSGGMRQRVGLARALVAEPEVLCMDEPFSALDVLTAESLRTEVVDLWRGAGHVGLKSIFLVTHNIVEAVFIATRIVIISTHPGRVRNVIVNALPYPRDVNSKPFAAMVDQVHAAITALVLPDEPTEGAVAAGGPGAGPTTALAGAPERRRRSGGPGRADSERAGGNDHRAARNHRGCAGNDQRVRPECPDRQGVRRNDRHRQGGRDAGPGRHAQGRRADDPGGVVLPRRAALRRARRFSGRRS